MTAIKERGETDFAEAGEGVYLRFRNSDLKKIEAVLGPQWFNEMVDSFVHGVVKWSILELLLEHGVKKAAEPYAIPEEVLDEIVVVDIAEKCMDAACRSMRGMTAKEFVDEIMEAFKDRSDIDPLSSSLDSTSSTISEGDASGPESA